MQTDPAELTWVTIHVDYSTERRTQLLSAGLQRVRSIPSPLFGSTTGVIPRVNETKITALPGVLMGV